MYQKLKLPKHKVFLKAIFKKKKKREKIPTSNEKVMTIPPGAKGARQPLLSSVTQVLRDLIKNQRKRRAPGPAFIIIWVGQSCISGDIQ